MAKNKKQPLKNKKSFKFKGPKGNYKKNKAKHDTKAKLILRNLSFKTSEDNLKQHFEVYGTVADVTLLKKPNGDLKGSGFIQFEDVECAKQALTNTNSKPFLGRSLQVDWANSKEKSTNNEETQPQKNNKYNIEPKIEQKFENSKDKGYLNRKGVGKKINESVPSKPIIKTRKARLIIRNISFKATEESLKEYFSPYGEVLESTLLKKPNGDLVGCGFIQMKTVQDASKAILKTNAQTFLGRPIHVDWAVAKNKYMSYITQKNDEEEFLKNDVKSEPESDDEPMNDSKDKNIQHVPIKKEDSDEEDEDTFSKATDESESDENDSEDESNSEEDDDVEMKPDDESLKVSANDAEDGNTIFLKNVPFSVTNEDLEEFIKPFGETKYALVCIDKLKEHSKGTAFIRFKNKEDADMFLSSGPEKLSIEGQVIQAFPAMFRERMKGKNVGKKEPKDARNLYLIKEGVILANSKAAHGVSASDITKRLTLEQSKSQMLRNLNRFISRYRLAIHNIPLHYTDEDLRKLCIEMANVKSHCLKECRVMRYLKAPLGPNGKHVSKGYGFVMFTRHEDALTCLRRLNNHPSIFDINNRPIVSFSIEDKAVINARKKRMEKSQQKNPHSKTYVPPSTEGVNEKPQKVANNEKQQNHNPKNKGNKKQTTHPNTGNSEKYAGEVGKPGNTRMRSKFKLRNEVMIHKENVKKENRKKRAVQRVGFMKKKEIVKQPKQKQNTGLKTKIKQSLQQKDERNFSDLVNKYKSKLTSSANPQKVKAKWFDTN